MALRSPISLEVAPAVTDRALDVAALFASIELTKFRFRIGCLFIGLGVFVFFVGHTLIVVRYFTPDFTDHSWWLTKILLGMGAAFAGREVVESLASAVKSIVGVK